MVFTAVLATVMIFGANAQRVWIGGSVGFDSNSFELDRSPHFTKTNAFSVAPELGVSVTQGFDIGFSFGFGSETHEFTRTSWTPNGQFIRTHEEKISSWAITPFIQYTVLAFGPLRLACRASVGFEGNKGLLPRYSEWNGYLLWDLDENASARGFSLNLMPLLYLDISRRISLFTKMNFLSANFSSMTYRLNNNEHSTISTINLGVDTNNVLNVGSLQFGMVLRL